MSFYVCAGLYAEGPSDYHFLLPLIDRVLKEMLAAHFTAQYDYAEPLPLPDVEAHGRARRIATAIADQWTTFTLFVIHSDGDGDPKSAYDRSIAPAIKLAQKERELSQRKDPLVVAPCIPERELEAWLLTDPPRVQASGPQERRASAPSRSFDGSEGSPRGFAQTHWYASCPSFRGFRPADQPRCPPPARRLPRLRGRAAGRPPPARQARRTLITPARAPRRPAAGSPSPASRRRRGGAARSSRRAGR